MKRIDQRKKVVILGLDCAEPSLVFDVFQAQLPTLKALKDQGCGIKLRSCDPPLTIPAWSCMMSGKDPGKLGCYGIRNRINYSYNSLRISTSDWIKEDRIWDVLGRKGLQSILVGVPQTYPVKPIQGCMVGCLLTPDKSCDYTYPSSLKTEIERIAQGYVIDIEDYRKVSPDVLFKMIWEMTIKRFEVFRYLLKTRPFDFAMMVEIGLDRLQHVFWHYYDKNHPLHLPNNPYQGFILKYYQLLDEQISATLEMLPPDTLVLIVSDHGAQPMQGGVRINQWLIREGHLSLREPCLAPKPLDETMVDWSKTQAWGEGGYFGRIFLNVRGREPSGIIPLSDYEKIRQLLASKLENMKGPSGDLIGNRVYFPEKLYPQTNGIAPDLMVYFGDLAWRSLGEVGVREIFSLHNDKGPDGANHAKDGIFISNVKCIPNERRENLKITEIAPLVLDYLDYNPES
jgi:predicted AlkP superfamily phosphohydrolase/phosphomutase